MAALPILVLNSGSSSIKFSVYEAGGDERRKLLEGVPADSLRRATVQSQLEVDDTTMEVRSLDLTFDASHLTGAATIAMRDRLALGARLAGPCGQIEETVVKAGHRAPLASPALPSERRGRASCRARRCRP